MKGTQGHRAEWWGEKEKVRASRKGQSQVTLALVLSKGHTKNPSSCYSMNSPGVGLEKGDHIATGPQNLGSFEGGDSGDCGCVEFRGVAKKSAG
jgi:hypothetical protein